LVLMLNMGICRLCRTAWRFGLSGVKAKRRRVSKSGAISLAAHSLDRDVLSRKHFVLQRVHAGCRLVYSAGERNRALQNGFQPLLALYPSRRILVLDYEMIIRDIQAQKLARRELMVEPVHRAILQVCQWVVPRSSRQFVLGQHGLLEPGFRLICGIVRGLTARPVAALHRLAPVAPARDSSAIDNLAFHMKPADQEIVAGVFQILK